MGRSYRDLPNLGSLAVFEAAARHLSFQAAAAEFNVTPGAVSRQIKALEADLGCALFLRIHRGVRLTQEGEELSRVLTAGFAQAAEVCSRLRAARARPSVTLAATTAVAALWLMPRLGAFWRDHQDITLNHVITDVASELRGPGIDLRIRYGGGSWPGEAAIKLFDDRLYPICGPGFAATLKNKTPEDLATLPLLQLQGVDPDWTDWQDWLRLAGLGQTGLPHANLKLRRFNNYAIALQAAQDDQGIALGWHSLVAPLLAAGTLVRLWDVEVPAPGAYYATWDSGRHLSAEAETLKAWLIETAAEQSS